MREQPVGGITVGSIEQADFDLLKRLIGRPGPINLPNERIEYNVGSFVLVLPEKFSGVCTHDGNVRRAEFQTHPQVRYGILSQSCSAISIASDSITLELPMAPDLTLKVTK